MFIHRKLQNYSASDYKIKNMSIEINSESEDKQRFKKI